MEEEGGALVNLLVSLPFHIPSYSSKADNPHRGSTAQEEKGKETYRQVCDVIRWRRGGAENVGENACAGLVWGWGKGEVPRLEKERGH